MCSSDLILSMTCNILDISISQMVCTYDVTTKAMYIKPFNYQPLANVERWLQMPDSYLLQVSSGFFYIMIVWIH